MNKDLTSGFDPIQSKIFNLHDCGANGENCPNCYQKS